MKKLFPIAILVFLLACKSSTEFTFTPPVGTTPDPLNYLALGDSYTIGQGVDEMERYPVQLTEKLRDGGLDLNDPQIIAVTGWRTDQLIEAIDNANLVADTFDLVSLLIGVNNQFQGGSIATYQTEFETLLQKAIQLAGGEKENVLVLSIPDYAFTPFGQGSNPTAITQGINNFNAVNKAITEAAEVRYFDITPISRQGLDEPELVASDGLHPSGEQYRRWVEQIFQDILIALDE